MRLGLCKFWEGKGRLWILRMVKGREGKASFIFGRGKGDFLGAVWGREGVFVGCGLGDVCLVFFGGRGVVVVVVVVLARVVI